MSVSPRHDFFAELDTCSKRLTASLEQNAWDAIPPELSNIQTAIDTFLATNQQNDALLSLRTQISSDTLKQSIISKNVQTIKDLVNGIDTVAMKLFCQTTVNKNADDAETFKILINRIDKEIKNNNLCKAALLLHEMKTHESLRKKLGEKPIEQIVRILSALNFQQPSAGKSTFKIEIIFFKELRDAMRAGNVERAKTLFDSVPGNFYDVEQLSDLLLEAFVSSKRLLWIQMIVDLLKRDGTLHPFVIALLYQNAVKENALDVVEWLIKEKIPISTREIMGKTPMGLALMNHCISVGKAIHPDFLLWYAEYLLLQPYSQVRESLMQAFFNSKATDVLEVIDILLKDEKIKTAFLTTLEDMRSFITHEGTLIARFPLQIHQHDMASSYKEKNQLYLPMQTEFSKSRYQVYREWVSELSPQMGFKESHRKLMKNRNKEYVQFRTTNEPTRIGARYKDFINLARSTFQNCTSENIAKTRTKIPVKSFIETDSDQLVDAFKYTLYYTLKNGRRIDLTSVFIFDEILMIPGFIDIEGVWMHTPPENLEALGNACQELFHEVMAMPKDLSSVAPSETLKRTIALFYYLGIQAMFTERGNSQYLLEMHKGLYEHHGFATAPLSQNFVLPDCVALTVPFEVFYNVYYDKLFEWKPTRIQQKPLA